MLAKWLARVDVFLYAYLVMVLGCIYFLFNYIEGISFTERAGESVLFRGCWLVLYLLLLLQILRHSHSFILLLSRSHLFLIFILLAVASQLHSESADAGYVKFAMYLATVLFGAFLSVSCSADELVEALFRIGAVTLVVHVLLLPIIGADFSYDALHRVTILGTEAYAGIFGHKNLAGAFFGLMVIVSLVRALAGRRSQRRLSGGVAACHMLALAATGAAGPLVSLLATLAVTFGLALIVIGRRDLAAFYWLLLGFAGLAILAVPTEWLYGLVGRTANLTGRSFLWSVWPHFFWQHPWLGYGFSGFFNGLDNAPSAELTRMAPWNTEFGSFENSYLDALLQFGLLGGGLYLLLVVAAVWNVIAFAFRASGMFWLAPFAILIFIIITSLNDSSQLLHNYFGCVLVFWCYFGPEAQLGRSTMALSRLSLRDLRT
ncbi:hypothetical protein SSBR45G_16680 [Bradyrhizobium sp. SSBR45G]|uniref:O-antigen ligase family protein n=1 Tax=unclassified Bradyrhizobium TaxID=2631580 RepID=UPI002342BA38|nr:MULTISPECIES: O-antigen ligase family protein [unclassified Bradyrhizobium]GLH76760.1 hypothetical protein SSBR45G_16680 [Bradyrhizobium sp. SSBR45G]GLH83518.1 hypothetical protein SSBR45R_09780 [Bradyrhizobium sp. SSBR45R]